MGILNDTLSDASRPLPQLTLRRAADDAAPEFTPEFTPEPADDGGEALTVYRLQKDGGDSPPVAPPAPRAVDAGTRMVGPLHAPIGMYDDASPQFVTSIEGLEAGKEPVSTWNSDATDRQERLVSPEPSRRLHYGVSTGSSVFSNRVPSPFDDPGKLVHRIDSSDGMRRATGRGAPSGEPDTAAAAEARAAAPDAPDIGRPDWPPAPGDASGIAIAAEPAAPLISQTPRRPGSAVARQDGAPAAHGAAAAPVTQPATASLQATGRQEAPPVALAMSMPATTPAPQPRLSIGRIEVTVLAAPQPAPKAAAAQRSDAFLSKHYLRRL